MPKYKKSIFKEGNFLERGSLLPLIAILVVVLGLIAGFFLFKDRFQGGSKSQTSVIDEVKIGLKSAPLGFYGEESVEYESPTFNFNSNIFEGLTTFTKDLKFASRQLVESWDNPDDTTWRLHLRKGVKFHDGSDFSAEDAKFSIDFGKEYVVKDDLSQVQSVEIVDPYTILIKTKGAAPLLLNNLINVFVLSKDYVEKEGFAKPNGTGPYKFVQKVGNTYQLSANESYYLGAPKIKNVSYEVIEEDDERVNALKTGKVDLIEDLPAKNIPDITKTNNLAFKGVPSLRVIYLGLDTKSAKLKYSSAPTNPLKDLRVRQAIYKAINEDQIVSEVMSNHAYAIGQPATSVNFGFNPNVIRPKFDPEGAKALLKEAGFESGFDIVLDVPNNRYQNDEAIGAMVAKQLALVGIQVKLNAMPKEEYFPKVLDEKDTSFYLLGWSQENGDAGGAYETLIHTPTADEGFGSFNIGGYSNLAVDELIEKAANVVNSVDRLGILQNLAKVAMDDVPVIPLHQQEDSFAINRRFDWVPRRDNGIRAFEISSATK